MPDKQMRSRHRKLNHDLIDAVVMRDIAKDRELLKQGADVNARDDEHNETPLILAVKLVGSAMVRLLLEAGADVSARDDRGRTALFYASALTDVFKELLGAGADLHAIDKEGNTILLMRMWEAPSGSEVEELLRQGVDAAHRNEDGETAVEIAERLGLVKIVERLRAGTAV